MKNLVLLTDQFKSEFKEQAEQAKKVASCIIKESKEDLSKNISFINELFSKEVGGNRFKINKKDIHKRIQSGAVIKKQCEDLSSLNTV